MLELFTRHGGFDLQLEARGDLDVDQHHTVEDIGIVLGQAVRQALGSKKGINRAGYFVMPMDETLALAAIDLSGRPYLVLNAPIKARRVGDLQAELLEDFFHGFATSAAANVHLKVVYGRSSHHAVEAIFKAFARALRYACSRDARLKSQLPSTKGLPVIALVDYGAGNVGSVLKAVEYLGFPSEITSDPAQLQHADKIILPGQGHFGSMLTALEDRGLFAPLRKKIQEGTPYLGICLGLQALYEKSEEAPGIAGLGLLQGTVLRFKAHDKVPQIGWNQVQFRRGCRLFQLIPDGSFAYYCHSYYGPVVPEAVAVTEYGETYATGIEKANVFAVQFHPEKSGEVGLRVLKNFLDL